MIPFFGNNKHIDLSKLFQKIVPVIHYLLPIKIVNISTKLLLSMVKREENPYVL